MSEEIKKRRKIEKEFFYMLIFIPVVLVVVIGGFVLTNDINQLKQKIQTDCITTNSCQAFTQNNTNEITECVEFEYNGTIMSRYYLETMCALRNGQQNKQCNLQMTNNQATIIIQDFVTNETENLTLTNCFKATKMIYYTENNPKGVVQ